MALTNAIVAPRYGAALFALASETKQIERVEEDLQQLAVVFKDNPSLLAALSAPEIAPTAKQQLLNTLKQGAVEPVANLVQMVSDYGRIAALPAIIADYTQRAQAATGVVTGTVTTAVPLNDAQAEKLSVAVARKLGAQVAHLQQRVDASVIGGVRVEAANLIIDGTIQTKMMKLREQLLAR